MCSQAEGLFAAANVFSALKLVHLFSINPHLGPLQVSLGRMVIDIVKFFFIYSLVLFAFACGEWNALSLSHKSSRDITHDFIHKPHATVNMTLSICSSSCFHHIFVYNMQTLQKKVSTSCCGIMLIWRRPNAIAYQKDYRIGTMKEMPAWNGEDLESKLWTPIRFDLTLFASFLSACSNHRSRCFGLRSAWLDSRISSCLASRPTLDFGDFWCSAHTPW